MSSYRNVRSAVGRRTATFLAALGAVVALMSFGSAPAFAAPSAAASCTGTVAGLETAAGDQQVAKVGTAFSTDLEVQVVGTGGCPLQGATVTFTAPTSGPTASFAGGASIVSVATGAAGSASAPQLTANDVTGTYQVEATVGSFSLEFSLTNTTVGTVSSITAVSGNDQSAAVGAEFAAPLTVSVTDAFGDPIEGASVTFSVPSSKAGAAPTFSGGSAVATVQTGFDGTATSPALTAGTVSGTATVSASVEGASPVSFSLTVAAGAPYVLTLDQGNDQTALAGTDFAVPLAVTVTDEYGNLVAGAQVSFRAPSGGASGIFGAGGQAVTVATNAQGVAQAPDLSANAHAGGYVVIASVRGVPGPVTFAMVNEARTSAATSGASGNYWAVTRTGKVYASGAAPNFGSLATAGRSPVVALVALPSRTGYWLATATGHVYAFGSARSYGNGSAKFSLPIVAMAATADGKGYWLAWPTGRVFAFGDAVPYSDRSASAKIKDVTAMAATPDGKGYWLVTAAGGVFAYGDAAYRGSLSGAHMATRVVGIAASSEGGYWLVTEDGRVFGFGPGAPVYGRSKGIAPVPVVGLTPTQDGYGYWLVSANGTLTGFGDAGSQGTPARVSKDLVAAAS